MFCSLVEELLVQGHAKVAGNGAQVVVGDGLYLVLIAFMVCTVINATENKLPKFNSAVFENTYLFSYFFDILYK